MKITTDNINVDNSISTYKCPVGDIGTVLLLPSQVKKYLGSYEKHKMLNYGILLSKEYLLDIVLEESYNNEQWLLVIYNDKYYYTPKKYINVSKTVSIDTNINKLSGIVDNKSRRVMATATSSKHTIITYPEGCIIEALSDIELRSGPDSDYELVRVLQKGEKCIIHATIKNNEYNSSWFVTSTFTPNIEIYGKYINNNNVKIIVPKKQYSMILSNTDCTLMNNKSYNSLSKGTLISPKYEDNGYYIDVAKGSKGLITYKYPVKNTAPLCDSDDMLNKRYIGELQVTKKAIVYEFHKKSEYPPYSNDRDLSLIDISFASLIAARSYTSDVAKIIDHGCDEINNSIANKTNARILSPDETMIVTNYVIIGNKNYYIGFKKTSSYKGTSNYIILKRDKEFVDYTIKSVNMSTDIPISGNSYNTVDNVSNTSNTNTVYNTNTYENSDKSVNVPVIKTYNIKSEEVHSVHLATDSNTKIPGIENMAETPPEYAGWPVLSAVERYNLSAEAPFDNKHLTHINRFRLPTGNSGMSTKSFIFVTRPDLNLYHDTDGTVNEWAMNPDLKRLPCFKYIARMRGTPESPGIGTTIMDSLEYFGSTSINSPWLTVFTNQCNGYSINDRTIDVTEMAETFHGNKVLYAEPTFKHKIGGTVQIPFIERRDLTLYFTLRMWIEYIQAVSIGFCEPRGCHRRDHELDYAVSLFYITTDETMENILYWEKLTGLIPLTVPDSFFEWSEGNGAREMKYTIDFAYSFRTVMDELHLAEINNLYKKRTNSDANATGMPIVPANNYDYIHDANNNLLLSRLAAFYGKITDTDDNIESLIQNKPELEKYYYGGIVSSDGTNSIVDSYTVKGSTDGQATGTSSAKFLPNYNMHTRMYGIPYVKGPFIEHDPSAQKYKLRWV